MYIWNTTSVYYKQLNTLDIALLPYRVYRARYCGLDAMQATRHLRDQTTQPFTPCFPDFAYSPCFALFRRRLLDLHFPVHARFDLVLGGVVALADGDGHVQQVLIRALIFE